MSGLAGPGRRPARVAHDRPAGPLHKTRSAVIARHGMAATSQPLATATAIRVLAARGQRGRRRDRGQRRARRGRADVVRHRRRPVRDRLGRQDQEALRPERQRPLAGTPPRSSCFKAKGLTEIPDARAAELVGARLRRRLGPAPQAVRHQALAELLAPAIDYAEDGFPVSEIIAGDWHGAEPSLQRDSRPRPPASCPAAMRPARATVFRNPGLARSLRTDRRRTAATPSTRAARRGDRRLFASRSAACSPSRISPSTPAPGSSRSRPTTAATTSGSFRPTARGSPCSRCSTCSSRTT